MMIRRATTSALLLAALACVSRAGAAPNTNPTVPECLDASERGQTLRNEGSLSKATARFAECSSASCPAPVRSSCRKWLASVIESMPSVVVAPRNASDEDVASATVLVDGSPVEAAVESGKAISLDPGPHVLTVKAPAYASVEEKIIVRVGEKNRLIRVRLEPATTQPVAPPPPAPPPPPPPPAEPMPVLALGLGGVAVAAIATSLVLGFTTRSALDDLKSDPCASTRTCSEDETSSLRTRFIIADVALGVGVVAAGLAVWAWLSTPKKPLTRQASATFDPARAFRF